MEKRGLVNILKERNISQDAKICWADEMRLGLISQVRRFWCSIGTKIVQKIRISYKYVYLHLAVDGINGTVHWQWEADMKTESVIDAVESWEEQDEDKNIDVIIWDGASSHRSHKLQRVKPILICQPPYAPELNPAERVFEAIRQEVEGVIYESLADKQKTVDLFLERLQSQPEKIQSLAGWQWIRDAIRELPVPVT